MQHEIFAVSIHRNQRKIQSLEKYNAKTDAFLLGGQQNKVKDASVAKRQITEEMQPHVFMGRERLPREYKIKLVTSAILTTVCDLCIFLLENARQE